MPKENLPRQIIEQTLGLEHEELADALANLGEVALLKRNREDALFHFEKAMKILLCHFPPEHPKCLDCRKKLNALL